MSLNANDFQAVTYHAAPSMRAYNSTALTLTTSTLTNVVLNTIVYDRWNMVDTSTASEKHTVRVPGIYLVGFSISFDINSTGVRAVNIKHFNSSDALRAILASISTDATAATISTRYSTTAASLVAEVGDYFVIEAFQNSGGDLDIIAATATNQFNQSAFATWHSRG